MYSVQKDNVDEGLKKKKESRKDNDDQIALKELWEFY